jgi:DNA invertase Pin-like site-specific DNA recombinase
MAWQNYSANSAPRSIGYARVSTLDQNPDLQLTALREAGCDPIFTDQVSGIVRTRPGLERALDLLHPGDRFTVWKLDRLGRSLADLLALLERFRSTGVAFSSLTEALDTSTPTGELIFAIFGAIAQYERALIKERIAAGILAAKRRGKTFGRPRSLTAESLAIARAAIELGENKDFIARGLGVDPTTLRRALRRDDIAQMMPFERHSRACDRR